MDDLQRDLSSRVLEDYQAGKLTRREFLQRMAIISGGAVLGLSILGDLARIYPSCRMGLLPGQPAGLSNQPAAPPGAPNILFIVIDTLRADHLSSHGYERLTSPTVDRLAREGALFETAFSTSPYTAPSHASLLTGQYPHQHQVQWSDRRPVLNGGHPTLPEVLQARGYRTAAFSANHFWFTREQGFGRGFARFEDTYGSPMGMAMRTVYGRRIENEIIKRYVEDYPWRIDADDINSSVLHWVKRDLRRPFFAFLNYFDVHDPYLPPQPFRGRFSQQESPGGIINSYQDRFNPEMSPQEFQEEIDAYDGAIAYVDDRVDRLLQHLNDLGLGQNLMVIITSDHGEAFGEHGLFLHPNSVYREEIHVPLVIWDPQRIPPEVRVSHPVSNAALPATVMDLIDREGDNLFPRRSLAHFWEHPEAADQAGWPLVEMEHWYWWHPAAPSSQGAMRSMVSPEYHYIEHDVLAPELYHWHHDPREVHNLADTPDGLAIIEGFRGRLGEYYVRA
jgi:arylsulfatase A-like enzyme